MQDFLCIIIKYAPCESVFSGLFAKSFLRTVIIMKPCVKIGSLFMAVLMALTALFAVGCTPISLSAQWAYKSGDNELPIGVYIYSLNSAYAQAQTYASEQIKDYDAKTDKWLDEKIKDDDGKEQVAREWIKEQAELMCLSYLVVDEQIVKEKAEVTKDMLATADEQAKEYWNVGPAEYVQMGYYMPYKNQFEQYGVSLESFAYCTTEYSTKYSALFEAIYDKGGSQEVSDSELTQYFNENYSDYSYVFVNLYESTADEASDEGTKNVALAEDEVKKLKKEFDGYAKKLNDGADFDDVMKDYMKANDMEDDPSTSAIEDLEKNSSLGDELKEAIKKIDGKGAATIQVGKDDSAVYYLVYKRDIKSTSDKYLADDANRSSVLSAAKSEDFADYIEELTKKLDFEANTAQLDRYDPKMFFVKPEDSDENADDDASTEEE